MVIKYPVDESRPFYGKFWPNGVPHQLDMDFSMTMGDLLDRAVKNWGDDPAIWFLNTFITYKELEDKASRFATYLDSIGVKKGDVVALHLPNCIQYVVAYYGCAKIGAIVTGINPTYKPLEILHQIKLTGAKYILALDALYVHFVKPIEEKWEFKKIIWTNLVDEASGLSPILKILGKLLKKIPKAKINQANAISWKEVMKTEPNVPRVKFDVNHDPVTLIMTGGTTGVPKAAELTHLNLVSNARQAELLMTQQFEPGKENEKRMGHQTCAIGVLPLYHSFAMTGVMNISVACGGYMMLFPTPPETEELIKEICSMPNYNGFYYPGAEILFQRIAQLPQETIDKYPDLKNRLKICLSAAGPLHDYVREPFERKTSAAITEAYGLTESSPLVSGNNLFGYRESGYIGVPAPGTDWDIFDIEDFSRGPVNKLGEEGTGEICVCGPQVMKGYWQNPERTAATIKEYDGRNWLLTGDIGFMDEHGRIAIRDRKKMLIKMAGHSVFPAEVESFLGSHEQVEEAAVSGLPDPKTGECVKAWVVLKPGATVTSEELLAWAQENFTKWKCPKYIDIIDEIPKNLIGKVQRRSLQEADPLFKKNA